MKTRAIKYVFGIALLFSMDIADARNRSEFGNSSEGGSSYGAQIRGSAKKGDSCAAIRSTVTQVVGSAKAGCYMRLFLKESTCQWNKPQKKGNAGNPYAAYGLCSIERSPAVRAANNRGPACANIGTLAGQIKCCQSMMRNTSRSGSYFGPVRRRELPKCE